MKTEDLKIHSRSQQILNESWGNLTESQQRYIRAWETQLWPSLKEFNLLCEQELSQEQIQQIFQQAEQSSERTGIGKAAATIAKIDTALINLGKKAQQAGPIKDMDAKFEQLKADIAKKSQDNKIVKGVEAVSKWAKANPNKASFAVGILTTVAAFAGGPAGGAAAGLVLRSAKGLLQGEQLSTAVGKSARLTVYGAMAGWAIQTIGDWMEGISAEFVPYEKVPGLTKVTINLENTISAPGATFQQSIGEAWIPAADQAYVDGLVQSSRQGNLAAFNELFRYVQGVDLQHELTKIGIEQDFVKQLAIENSQFVKTLEIANQTISAIAQGSVSGKIDPKNVKVESSNESSKVGESQVHQIMQFLSEDDGFLGKVKQFGKNITTKITADKLFKAWKRAGAPQDSNKLASLLVSLGVAQDKIAGIYAKLNIEAPSIQQTQSQAQDDEEDDVADEIAKDEQRLATENNSKLIADYLFNANQEQLQAFIAIVDDQISINQSFAEAKEQISAMSSQQAEQVIALIDEFLDK